MLCQTCTCPPLWSASTLQVLHNVLHRTDNVSSCQRNQPRTVIFAYPLASLQIWHAVAVHFIVSELIGHLCGLCLGKCELAHVCRSFTNGTCANCRHVSMHQSCPARRLLALFSLWQCEVANFEATQVPVAHEIRVPQQPIACHMPYLGWVVMKWCGSQGSCHCTSSPNAPICSL